MGPTHLLCGSDAAPIALAGHPGLCIALIESHWNRSLSKATLQGSQLDGSMAPRCLLRLQRPTKLVCADVPMLVCTLSNGRVAPKPRRLWLHGCMLYTVAQLRSYERPSAYNIYSCVCMLDFAPVCCAGVRPATRTCSRAMHLD